jgi:hypothetical protein
MRTLLPALAALVAACAARRPAPDATIVRIDRLGEAPVAPGTVYEIPAGTDLPVSLELAAPFLDAARADPAVTLRFTRTVYWCPEIPEVVSLDGTTWRRIRDLYRGTLRVGLGRSRSEEGPHGEVSLRLAPREP